MLNMRISPKGTSFLKRLFWLIAIWSLSVLALGVVSLILRAMLTAAGMKT
ncbi:DUF2474 domain-containing protein [Raoultella terrigena]|nr:DUF2474 domain-containing protein [Raoultella terrigena]